MKRAFVLLLLLALGGSAVADPLVPEPGRQPEKGASRSKLRPIPFFYRQMDHDSINKGAPGRMNATRGEQQEQQTGWTPPPLGGNPM